MQVLILHHYIGVVVWFPVLVGTNIELSTTVLRQDTGVQDFERKCHLECQTCLGNLQPNITQGKVWNHTKAEESSTKILMLLRVIQNNLK